MTNLKVYELYFRNVAAYILRIKVDGKEPDEVMMREIEKGANIDQTFAHNFRLFCLAKERAIDILLGQPILLDQPLDGADWTNTRSLDESIKDYANRH